MALLSKFFAHDYDSFELRGGNINALAAQPTRGECSSPQGSHRLVQSEQCRADPGVSPSRRAGRLISKANWKPSIKNWKTACASARKRALICFRCSKVSKPGCWCSTAILHPTFVNRRLTELTGDVDDERAVQLLGRQAWPPICAAATNTFCRSNARKSFKGPAGS